MRIELLQEDVTSPSILYQGTYSIKKCVKAPVVIATGGIYKSNKKITSISLLINQGVLFQARYRVHRAHLAPTGCGAKDGTQEVENPTFENVHTRKK